MVIKHVISDYDGTQTDVEAEGRPFVAGYTKALLHLTGLDTGTFHSLFDGVSSLIHKHPHRFGVEREMGEESVIVAPAIVDPYLRMQTIATAIFDREGRFLNPIDRANLLEHLFLEHYAKTLIVPRLGAVELMTALNLADSVGFSIVTNARTKSVENKLQVMGMNPDSVHLCGDAQKFTLGTLPVDMASPVNLLPPDSPETRWCHLHRVKYYEVLNAIRQKHGLDWSEICVIGDIFELDLALPFFLGCEVILVVNDHTPRYEIEWIGHNGCGRAHCYADLSDVRMHLIGY